MSAAGAGILQLASDLRAITRHSGDPGVIAERVRPLVQELARSPTWLVAEHFECDSDQGFGAHLLHEETDHTLAIFAGAWLPGRGAPPHNHGTWAVIAGVVGLERNTIWTRLDDGSRQGYAELRRLEDHVLGPGDVFGEMALLDGQPRSASAIALEDTTLQMLGHDEFQRQLLASPPLAGALLAMLSRRVRHVLDNAEILASLDVYGRLARVLLDIAQRHGVQDRGTVINVALTQQELATMVGATRERINRALAAFKAKSRQPEAEAVSAWLARRG